MAKKPHDVPPDSTIAFRGEAASDGGATPATEILVTERTIIARPLGRADDEARSSVSVELADVVSLRCSGMLCRTMTLETPDGPHTIPTTGLDERALRNAIVESAGLHNDCSTVGLETLGVCLCGPGTYAGCLLTVLGLGLTFTVVGALFGAVIGGVGVAILAAVFVAHTVAERRGANVWTRSAT
jgi:hypothetical protein